MRLDRRGDGQLIDADELAGMLRCGGRGLRVIDCRGPGIRCPRPGEFDALGHIPGAVCASLVGDLAGPADGRGVYQLTGLAEAMAWLDRLGLRRGMPVVCYDQGEGVVAARCWWLLRWLGWPDVRVLDGGLPAWRAAGLPVESDASVLPESCVRRISLRREWLAGARGFACNACIIDARPRGEPVLEGVRALPAAGNLAADGRMRDPAALRARFHHVVDACPAGVLHVCDSGLSACLNMLAMAHAGLPPGRLLPAACGGCRHRQGRSPDAVAGTVQEDVGVCL